MIAVIICVISLAALVQFSIFYCRSMILTTAAESISDRVRKAAGVAGEALGAEDFGALAGLHALCPELEADGQGLRAVSIYYRMVAALRWLCGSRLPACSAWAQHEMATCSRYAAVLLDQRLERNLACRAEIHSC